MDYLVCNHYNLGDDFVYYLVGVYESIREKQRMIHLNTWLEVDFHHFVVDNNIDEIFVRQCNHPEGIRCVAVVPNYPSQFNIGKHILKCDKCGGWMLLPNASEAAHLYTCQDCGKQKRRMFRWQSSNSNSGKLFFETVEDVRAISKIARTYYSTLGVWDSAILDGGAVYNDKYLRGYTLGIDIDLIDGTLFDYKNVVAMNDALDMIRDELSTFVPNSYNLQTSGNGVYVLIHHSLITEDFYNAIHLWSLLLDKMVREHEMPRVNIQVGNDFARVYKMVGSIHLVLPTVAVPLPHNVNLTKFNMHSTEVENINTDNWKDIFYNRCDKGEATDLLRKFQEIHEEFYDEASFLSKQKDRNSILLDADLDDEKDSDVFRKRKKANIIKKSRGKQLCAGVTHHKDYTSSNRLYVVRDNYRIQNMEESELKKILEMYGLKIQDFLGQSVKR